MVPAFHCYGCRDVMRKRSIFCTGILRTPRTPYLEVPGLSLARRPLFP